MDRIFSENYVLSKSGLSSFFAEVDGDCFGDEIEVNEGVAACGESGHRCKYKQPILSAKIKIMGGWFFSVGEWLVGK